jgi:hypothetical protein
MNIRRDIMQLEVGKTVYLKRVGNNARGYKDRPIEDLIEEYQIKKVGRKYFEVWKDEKEYNTVKFYIENYKQVTEYSDT